MQSEKHTPKLHTLPANLRLFYSQAASDRVNMCVCIPAKFASFAMLDFTFMMLTVRLFFYNMILFFLYVSVVNRMKCAHSRAMRCILWIVDWFGIDLIGEPHKV